MSPTISVLIASSGRRTLLSAIESTVGQFHYGDELIVDVNDDSPAGHAARNRMMSRAKGDALLFLDDDDAHVSGAIETCRCAYRQDPGRVHVFRMRYPDGRVLWDIPAVEMGHVSTQMILAPNGAPRAWGDRYEGDYDFLVAACAALGDPVWHEDVIALVRPGG